MTRAAVVPRLIAVAAVMSRWWRMGGLEVVVARIARHGVTAVGRASEVFAMTGRATKGPSPGIFAVGDVMASCGRDEDMTGETETEARIVEEVSRSVVVLAVAGSTLQLSRFQHIAIDGAARRDLADGRGRVLQAAMRIGQKRVVDKADGMVVGQIGSESRLAGDESSTV